MTICSLIIGLVIHILKQRIKREKVIPQEDILIKKLNEYPLVKEKMGEIILTFKDDSKKEMIFFIGLKLDNENIGVTIKELDIMKELGIIFQQQESYTFNEYQKPEKIWMRYFNFGIHINLKEMLKKKESKIPQKPNVTMEEALDSYFYFYKLTTLGKKIYETLPKRKNKKYLKAIINKITTVKYAEFEKVEIKYGEIENKNGEEFITNPMIYNIDAN